MATIDPEIQVMSTCYDALQAIDNDGKERVINWLVKKFELKAPTSQKTSGNNSSDKGGGGSDGEAKTGLQQFETVADLFSQATPEIDNDKVLLVAAFLQSKGNLSELAAGAIQTELKHMGHAVSNITSCLTALGNLKPKYIVQTRKEGKSQQARKKYKVTTEGLKAANDLLNVTE